MSAAEPTIAVVVPNRNDSRYLARSLTSIFDQPVAPDEVIVVDDDSTDDSVSRIRALIAGRPQARLIQNPVNLGVCGTINEGFRHASSEYVLFVASNDFVLPGIFARAKQCLGQAVGAGLWSAMAWIVDEENRPKRLHPSPVVAFEDAWLPPEHCRRLALRLGNWFTGTSLIFRRDALAAAGGFNASFMGLADWVTALTVASRHGAAYTPEPLCVIRKHAGSYLDATLADLGRLDDVLGRVFDYGRRVEPSLFTPRFAKRTVRRFRFASVRSTDGATLTGLGHKLLPTGWSRLRTLWAFVALCPFDILPVLWHRVCGWLYVRLRSRRPRLV